MRPTRRRISGFVAGRIQARRKAQTLALVESLEGRTLLAAQVMTDLLDYAPGSTAQITAWNNADEGIDFAVGETVNFFIDRTDGIPVEAPPAIQTWNVTDNVGDFEAYQDDLGMWWFPDLDPTEGAVATTWYVDPQFAGASLILTATGQSSGAVAETEFTDAPRISTVTVGAQTGAVSYGTAGSVTYTVSATRGQNGTVNGTYNVVSGLPDGVTASFSPTSFTSNGGSGFPNSTLTLIVGAAVPAGSYNFTVRLADGADQAQNTGTLIVSARAVTLSGTRVYDGTTDATSGILSITNIVGSDAVTVASGTATLASKDVGPRPITSMGTLTLSGAQASNYTLTGASGSVSITQKALAITANNQTQDYGAGNNLTQGVSFTGLVAGDVVTASLATNASTSSSGNWNAGTWSITPSAATGVDVGNYAPISYADGTLQVDAIALTVTANNKSKTYGDANPALDATVVGQVVGGDAILYTLATTATQFSDVAGSPYAITVSLGSNPNYDVTVVDGTLTINKAVATVTANNKSKTYGDANPALDATVVGQVVGGDAILYTLATTATQFSDVAGSPYAITVSLGSNPNYDVTAFDGTLTINKAVATVTANNKSKTYGDANPALDATVVGQVVGGDAILYTLATTATQFSDVAGSPYAITVSLGSNPNYDVTVVDGTLTINKAVATVTANNKSKTYGDANPALDATVVGQVVGGDAILYTLATTATQFSDVAGSPYAITVSLGSNPNYDVTAFDGTLTINAATATATLTLSPSPVQYSDQSTFTVTIDLGVVGGDQAATGVQFKIGVIDYGGVVALVDMGSYLEASLTTQILNNVGTYTVSAVLTGTSTNFLISDPVDQTLTVAKEDAKVDYTGSTYVSTSSPSSSTATVVLMATIRDISAVPGDTAHDAFAGDIRNARVSFINLDNNTVIASNLIPQLVDPNDIKTGTVAFDWSVNIGSSDSVSYTIGVVVNGDYCGNDQTVVTVKKPTTGSIGGGGYLINSESVGTYAGAAGKKTNFGLNVKFNKSGKNLQGSVNIIVRAADGKTYQFKSNAINSLIMNGSETAPFTATFISKANVTDITDPLNPISLGGNKTLQITITDAGEPGSSDTIGILLTESNGAVLFSSNWDGVTTVEQLLGGGNLQVRPAQLVDGPVGVGAPAGTTITTADVEALLPAAAAYWQSTGVANAARLEALLESIAIQIGEFPDDGLAWAMPGVITIDTDAAGHGWFVSDTPGATVPVGRVDLLTVLTHELGHFLGQSTVFGDSDDIMAIALPVGTSRTVPLPRSMDSSPVDSRGLGSKPSRAAHPEFSFPSGVTLPVWSAAVHLGPVSAHVQAPTNGISSHTAELLDDIARTQVRDRRRPGAPRRA